jgi:endogenous inhibitor of DNA gyrase (YacG/DUF329 family)
VVVVVFFPILRRKKLGSGRSSAPASVILSDPPWWLNEGEKMLVECPECQTAISDAATACPHCGHPLTQTGKKIGPRKTYQQWARGFGFLFLLGLGWLLFQEPDQTRMPGIILLWIGFLGWLAFKWRVWFHS